MHFCPSSLPRADGKWNGKTAQNKRTRKGLGCIYTYIYIYIIISNIRISLRTGHPKYPNWNFEHFQAISRCLSRVMEFDSESAESATGRLFVFQHWDHRQVLLIGIPRQPGTHASCVSGIGHERRSIQGGAPVDIISVGL